jgi:hypothetical protein
LWSSTMISWVPPMTIRMHLYEYSIAKTCVDISRN